jgi:uncharacterized membrane protein
MSDALFDRLYSVEQRLAALQREVRELRAEASGRTVTKPAQAAPPPRTLQHSVTKSVPAAAAAPAPEPRRAIATPAPSAPPKPPREIDLADLLGARALAWAGGVVTLLGVVLFFVLAVNHGWIGPVERIALGALASALLFGAGVLMRVRYGQLYSAYAAVGAGLAGGYATLLASAALYELVPDLAALGIAAAIAAVGVWIALAWSSETIAGIGLIGAMLVPVSVVFEDGITIVGTAFAAIMLAATAVVALRRGWDVLLGVGGFAAFAQAVWLVLQEGEGPPRSVVALAAAFWLLGVAIGILRQLREQTAALDRLAVSFLFASTVFAGAAATRLLNGEWLGASRQALALVVVAAVEALLATALFRRPGARDLSALLGAGALAVLGVAFADLLGGQTLAIAWAAQAAVLAWLAARIGETRYHAAALVYLALVAGHALVFDAPPQDLLQETAHPAAGAGALLAVAAAAIVFGFYARRWSAVAEGEGPIGRPVSAFFSWFAAQRRILRIAAFASAAVLSAYALALGLLAAFGDAFEWGQVAVTASWAAIAAAVFVAGVGAKRLDLQNAGLVWLGVTAVKLVGFDVATLPETQHGVAALVVAAALLVAGLELERPAHVLSPVGILLLAGSAVFAAGGALAVVTGDLGAVDGEGAALLLLAGVYAALTAWTFHATRDVATLLGGLALLLGLGASVLLLDHTALVAAWAVAAAALAWLATRLTEPRLLPAAVTLAGLALGATIVQLAPPLDLFAARDVPADGVPALLLCVGALLALARFVPVPRADGDDFDRRLAAVAPEWRERSLWAAGVVAVYAGSLALLGGVMWVSGVDLETEFQRGHTAVSAFWGIVGLVALYVGLRRHARSLRLAGFLLFGISLAKIFLYDLSRLSSISRAASFLAVGAVLLLGGFFYQRLSERQARAS